MRKVCIASLMVAFIGIEAVSAELVSIESNNLEAIVVQNQIGNISLTGSNKPSQVSVTKKKFDSSCSITYDKQGSTYSIKVKKKKNNDTCQVDLNIEVPSSISATLSTGMGDISVKDIDGSIQYNIGVGNTMLQDIEGQITGHVGKGNVTMNEIKGDTIISGGQGNSVIDFSPQFSEGKIKVSTGQGDIIVSFPDAVQLQSRLDTGWGSVQNDFSESASPKVKASLHTGMGNITIKKKTKSSKKAH